MCLPQPRKLAVSGGLGYAERVGGLGLVNNSQRVTGRMEETLRDLEQVMAAHRQVMAESRVVATDNVVALPLLATLPQAPD